jgi:hypothetical protein
LIIVALAAAVPLVELAYAVLEETRTRERRLRVLPSRVGIYFVLALALFPGAGCLGVWAKLTAALEGQGLPSPSGKALRDLRRRVGAAPLKALFEVLAGPAAQPSAPGVAFGRYRTVAFDGCTSIKVPDTERNRSWLGKMKAALGVTGYPAVELMTLVETGTRALLGAVFGPPATGETDYARRLLHLLTGGMLVLADRGFDGAAFLAEVTVTCADGDLGAAGPLPGAAPGHGHRRRDSPRHRPRPGQLHHRAGNRQADPHRSRWRRHRRPWPHRPHRPRRPGRPAAAPPPPGQRPQGQIPAVPLEQGRPAPAPAQHPGHRPDSHGQRPRNDTSDRDTPSRVLDRHARPLTPRRCG